MCWKEDMNILNFTGRQARLFTERSFVMKRTLSALVFSGLLALGVTAVATPSSASPVSLGAATVNALETKGSQPESVLKVDHRRGHHSGNHRRGHHSGNHRHRRHFGPGPVRPPWYRHRHHRNHWDHRRRRGGFSFDLNIQPAPRYRYAPRYALPAAHVQWCEARYRSYRISDNSFQPYNGPRRQCASPYFR